MSGWLERGWYLGGSAGILLRPLSLLFGQLVRLRQCLYRRGLFYSGHPGRPVIVVGNLTVGGSGKTPFTLWLARALAARGLRVGIVSRGYGGRASAPTEVSSMASADQVGDEPLILARRSGARVVISRDRLAAARQLAAEVDVIVADDGLQHYRLQRDFEIALVDGQRRCGNGQLLPAGPLREPIGRLAAVDATVVNGGASTGGEYAMALVATGFVDVASGARESLASWRGRRVHAIAGIGHPARFFAQLRSLGLDPIEHPLADHAILTARDVTFQDHLPIVMTEKDAVKCVGFPAGHRVYLEVEASLSPEDSERLLQAILTHAKFDAGGA